MKARAYPVGKTVAVQVAADDGGGGPVIFAYLEPTAAAVLAGQLGESANQIDPKVWAKVIRSIAAKRRRAKLARSRRKAVRS